MTGMSFSYFTVLKGSCKPVDMEKNVTALMLKIEVYNPYARAFFDLSWNKEKLVLDAIILRRSGCWGCIAFGFSFKRLSSLLKMTR
jgi:hypothetical protein